MVYFSKMYKTIQDVRRSIESESLNIALAQIKSLEADIRDLCEAELGRKGKIPFRDHIFKLFVNELKKAGIKQGVIAEIGGKQNSFLNRLPQFTPKYLSIYPVKDDSSVIVADITNCPHVPSESFDAIISIGVLEHVTRIHDAAREIIRLLKPNGITLHAVPFSYFFHGAPVDYWRVTPTAMSNLFEELETIEAYFYSENRRRNNMGSESNRIDQDGGPQFAPDAFGGWRENWFTIYIGRKLLDGATMLDLRRRKQLTID